MNNILEIVVDLIPIYIQFRYQIPIDSKDHLKKLYSDHTALMTRRLFRSLYHTISDVVFINYVVK
jgi:hypothetical protein